MFTVIVCERNRDQIDMYSHGTSRPADVSECDCAPEANKNGDMYQGYEQRKQISEVAVDIRV